MGVKTLIADITIERRVRTDVGDITQLKNSLHRLGQLVPIGVWVREQDDKKLYVLLHGLRRLEAAKALGWTEVEVAVLESTDDLLRLQAERDENTVRKPLTPSEMVAFAELIAPLEAKAAKDRQREGARRGGQASGPLPEASAGDARDRIAAAAGCSPNTLKKAKEVVAAANENPAKYGPLKAEMDRTGNISGAHARLKALKNQASRTKEANVSESATEEAFIAVGRALKCLQAIKPSQVTPLPDRFASALRGLRTVIDRLLGDGATQADQKPASAPGATAVLGHSALAEVLRRALTVLEESAARWQELRQRGATDDELGQRISQVFSASGDGPGYTCKGGKTPKFCLTEGGTSVKGKALIAEVRKALDIPAPLPTQASPQPSTTNGVTDSAHRAELNGEGSV